MRWAVRFIGLLLLASPVRASIDPTTFQQLSFRQHPGAQLPLDVRLIDSTGRSVTLGSALNRRPAVLVLEYLHCKNLCSLVLGGVVQAIVKAGLTPGSEVDLVAISIDPRETAQDAASAQAMYARTFPDPGTAASGLRFFTGSADQVREVAGIVGFPYRYDKATDQFAHPAGFVVTTSEGRISRYVLGLSPQPAALKHAIAEAALEQVEPPAHPLLCLCFGYDPDEGSVAALTLRLVRWTCAALAGALMLLIGFLALRRRSA